MPRRPRTNTASTAPSREDRPVEPAVADLDIASLATYPQQAAIYGDLPTAAMQTLVRSMQEDGQRDPIQVLPPGNAASLPAYTIIDGHQRVAAARELGWPKIRAVVRWDLVNASAEEIHRLFLRTNFERRQLSPMQQALVIVAIYEARTERRRKYFDDDDWRAVRDQIAEQLGISHRNAMRYVRVLNTPLAIQTAVRDGRLSCLSLAERIETLPQEQQEELAAQIENIHDPAEAKSLVESYLPLRRSRRSFNSHLDVLAAALDTAIANIDARIASITHPSTRSYIEKLEPGLRMLEQLVKQLKAIDPHADPLRDIADTMSPVNAGNADGGDGGTTD